MTDNFDVAFHGFDIYEIADHDIHGCTSRWKDRLDGGSEECALGLDWSHIVVEASDQHQHERGALG